MNKSFMGHLCKFRIVRIFNEHRILPYKIHIRKNILHTSPKG